MSEANNVRVPPRAPRERHRFRCKQCERCGSVVVRSNMKIHMQTVKCAELSAARQQQQEREQRANDDLESEKLYHDFDEVSGCANPFNVMLAELCSRQHMTDSCCDELLTLLRERCSEVPPSSFYLKRVLANTRHRVFMGEFDVNNNDGRLLHPAGVGVAANRGVAAPSRRVGSSVQ
jgi:hypothetical protein